MQTPAADEAELLQRDAKCISLTETLLAGNDINTVYAFPFRAGPVACNGLATYRSYHAAWAVAIRIKSFFGTDDDALLVESYRQLAACGTWEHASAMCPPQLRSEYLDVVMGLILCRLLQKAPAIGTPTSSQKSIASIQKLQFLLCVCPQAEPQLKYLLASIIASHWALFKADPRESALTLQTNPDSTATAAIVCIEQKYGHVGDIAVVAKFKRINLISCDRSEMAQASVEFETTSPLPLKCPPSRAWALPTIKSVHTTAAANGVQVAACTLAVNASLLCISTPP